MTKTSIIQLLILVFLNLKISCNCSCTGDVPFALLYKEHDFPYSRLAVLTKLNPIVCLQRWTIGRSCVKIFPNITIQLSVIVVRYRQNYRLKKNKRRKRDQKYFKLIFNRCHITADNSCFSHMAHVTMYAKM